jgi:hypothetical protein
MFQIVISELDCDGKVVAHWPVQPLYELWDHAVAIAEFDASRLSEDGSFEEADGCIQLTDTSGRALRIEVRELASIELAA